MSPAVHERKPVQSHMSSSTRGQATPCRLVIAAANAADTVAAAGGFIYDSVRQGWYVDVYLENPGHERALQILGVVGQEIPDSFEFEQWPDAVYLDAELYERHRHVRRLVSESVRQQHADFAVWQQRSQEGVDARPVLEHRLSTAARAFKFHAMKAAGLTARPTATESFRVA